MFKSIKKVLASLLVAVVVVGVGAVVWGMRPEKVEAVNPQEVETEASQEEVSSEYRYTGIESFWNEEALKDGIYTVGEASLIVESDHAELFGGKVDGAFMEHPIIVGKGIYGVNNYRRLVYWDCENMEETVVTKLADVDLDDHWTVIDQVDEYVLVEYFNDYTIYSKGVEIATVEANGYPERIATGESRSANFFNESDGTLYKLMVYGGDDPYMEFVQIAEDVELANYVYEVNALNTCTVLKDGKMYTPLPESEEVVEHEGLRGIVSDTNPKPQYELVELIPENFERVELEIYGDSCMLHSCYVFEMGYKEYSIIKRTENVTYNTDTEQTVEDMNKMDKVLEKVGYVVSTTEELNDKIDQINQKWAE